jgi:hypothetical protein
MSERNAARPGPDSGDLPAAGLSGRICAVGGQAARDAQKWLGRYDRLFSGGPFDPTLTGTICQCMAFSAPWLDAEELRMANRTALWGFGPDWLIDYAAETREQVQDVVEGCLDVADGGEPADDDLMLSLADIRDELSKAVAWPALRHLWRRHLADFLEAMALEWDWQAAFKNGTGRLPTFDEYIANADNYGYSWPFISHWIYTSKVAEPADIEQIDAASRQAQKVMRLINDLGTYERDLEWGDLNVLMLGLSREEVDARMADLTREFRRIADPLRADHPHLVNYLERQIEFCSGFYAITDYWGAL